MSRRINQSSLSLAMACVDPRSIGDAEGFGAAATLDACTTAGGDGSSAGAAVANAAMASKAASVHMADSKTTTGRATGLLMMMGSVL
ncbi:MAG TPA: hypothetical protein VFL86_07255 [Burkholderiaceae bacterium]|nr:hypothetical protein [Burkholderiaceae bacterium]